MTRTENDFPSEKKVRRARRDVTGRAACLLDRRDVIALYVEGDEERRIVSPRKSRMPRLAERCKEEEKNTKKAALDFGDALLLVFAPWTR